MASEKAFGCFSDVFSPFRPPFRKGLAVAFSLSPIVYGAAVYYEANVGSLIGLILLVLLSVDLPLLETLYSRDLIPI